MCLYTAINIRNCYCICSCRIINSDILGILTGTPRKLMNIDLLKKLGWEAKVSLKEGLRITYEDYLLKEEI